MNLYNSLFFIKNACSSSISTNFDFDSSKPVSILSKSNN